MKNNLYHAKLLILMLIMGSVTFNGCDNYITQDPGKPRAGGVYLSQAREGTIQVDLSNLDTEDTLACSANIGGVGAANTDIIVHFNSDASLVTAYNSAHATNYAALPSENYELSRKTDTIPAGVKYGGAIPLFIKNYPAALDTTQQYLLPITLEKVSGGLPINENLQTVYFVVTNVYYKKPAGSGTLLDPYRISSLDNLQWINENPSSWNAHFIQTKDIIASGTKNWNGGEGFIPIGKEAPYFEGSYDGQGHAITGLYIHRPDGNSVGFFSHTAPGSVVENLELKDVDVTGLKDVGGLAGIHYGRIEQVKISSGQVIGTDKGSDYENIGGLVGYNHGAIYSSDADVEVTAKGNHVGGLVGYGEEGTEIKDAHSTGNITGGGKEVGGLVGYNKGAIANCYATGQVHGTGGDYTGGLVGINYGPISDSYATGKVIADGGGGNGGLVGDTHGSITNCYATGDVISDHSNAGGLVGYMNDATIKNCYATGNVESKGDGIAGGLVGYAKDDADILNSFSTGDVRTASNYVGGLVGDSHSKIINCYAMGDASTGAAKYAGGLVGQFYDGTMENCYSTGKVTNPGGTAGGLSGNMGGKATISHSYWDIQSSGISVSFGGTGLSTADMQGTKARTTMLGFDFTGLWQAQTGDYPVLQHNHL